MQLAVDRPEARGANSTGYLNLNVGHTGGTPGDPRDGKSFWYARWDLDRVKEGEYALWILGSDRPAGTHALTLRVRPEDPTRSKRCCYFLDTLVVAPRGWRP